MKKKSLIKLGIFVAIIVMISFSDWTFAADDEKVKVLEGVAKWTNLAVSIFSWIWVWFAKGAGEFLMNKWVYGEIIGLDAYIWKLWNVMKNMANFGLGFYLIYAIFEGLITENGTKKIKDMILRSLVAGVGIQASWFMTAVVIDISTVTLVAAGTFPSQIVSNNSELEEDFGFAINDYLEVEVSDGKTIGDILKGVRFSLFSSEQGASKFITEVRDVPLDKKITRQELFQEIFPNADNVSGPLYYLGLALLETPKLVSVDSSGDAGLKSTIFNTLMQGATTIVYSIEMLILFVFAVMRVVYLWIFIVMSPLLVLLRCINKGTDGKNGKVDKKSWISKNINFTSFFWNAFKPTIIVLGFVVTMMFVTLMKGVIFSSAQREIDLGGATTFSYKESRANSGDSGDQKYVSVIDSDTVGISIRHVGKTILEFCLCIITVLLVYHILKLAVKMGGGDDFVSKGINSLQGGVGKFISKTPIVPVTTYDKDGKPVNSAISWDGLTSIPKRKYSKIMNEYENKDNKTLDSFMGFLGFNSDNGLSETERGNIRSKGQGQNEKGLSILEAKRDYIKGIRVEGGKGMKLSNTADTFWQDQFKSWLTNMNGKESDIRGANYQVWRDMVTWWNTGNNKDKGLQGLFKDDSSKERERVKAYADMFLLQLNNDYTWENLKDKDISSKEHTQTTGQQS